MQLKSRFSSVLWLAVLASSQLALAEYEYGYMPMGGRGSGNLAVETVNAQEAYTKAGQIIQKYQGSITSFNTNTEPRLKKQQITVQVSVNVEKVTDMMNELAALGKVTSRSFYEAAANTEYTSPQHQLADLDREIRKIRLGIGEIPIISGLIQKQRQTLQASMQVMDAGKGRARVSVTFVDEGYVAAYQSYYQNALLQRATAQIQPADSTPAKSIDFETILQNRNVLLGGIIALCFLILGMAIGRKKA